MRRLTATLALLICGAGSALASETAKTADPAQAIMDRTFQRLGAEFVENGETLTTDGPFVEMKEALGGYLFFEADDLEAAIELAARIPAARLGGAIEVRPLR